MTTVNDFTDILRIIREQPEWGEALRSALLSKELLQMPQTLAEFAKAANKRFDRLESDVSELKAGQARLESDVSELKVGQARLEEGQARLESDVSGLKVGQARLEEGQARQESDVSGLKVGQARLEEGQARQEDRQERFERTLSRLEGDVGNLKGDAYELKVGNNILSLIGQHTDIIPIRVLKGSRAPNDMTFLNPIYEARRKGIITERERVDAFAVDMVLEGRREAEEAPLFIVVEVSRTIADSDVNRASERAGIVQKATGRAALPAVVGAYADDTRRQLAQERNVAVITYGD